MSWRIEDGKSIGPGGALSPFYALSDLLAGMKVQVVREHNRAPAHAVIERAHAVDTCGQQGSVYRERCTSSDGGEVTEACELFRPCVHLRYRNGVRATANCLAFIRPLDSAVLQLAKLAEVSADHDK